jgi:hypothetical protein
MPAGARKSPPLAAGPIRFAIVTATITDLNSTLAGEKPLGLKTLILFKKNMVSAHFTEEFPTPASPASAPAARHNAK